MGKASCRELRPSVEVLSQSAAVPQGEVLAMNIRVSLFLEELSPIPGQA